MSHREAIERAFAPVPAPAAYVPRPAFEDALAALGRALDAGARVVLVRGPSGIGKSLLLRLLDRHLGSDYDVLHVAPGALPIADLIAFGLGSRAPRPGRTAAPLERPPDGPERSPRRCLVLPVDDAGGLAPAAARGLAGLVRNAEGSLRLVLALGQPPSPDLRASLGGEVAEVVLEQPMGPEEVASYLDQRLAGPEIEPAVRDTLLGAAGRLHAASGGNPRRLNQLALEVADGRTALADPPAGSVPVEPSLAELPRDPFGPAAASATYLPRPATEALLTAVERELLRGRRAVRIEGPSGIGKTTALKLLGAQLLEPFQALALPYTRLDPSEFWSLALHELGVQRGADPGRELVAVARRLARVEGTLVLLIDEATALPEETRAELARALDEAGGALRVVTTADDDAPGVRAGRLPDCAVLRLEERLTRAETEAYVIGRLLRFGAPVRVRRRFDARTIAALHHASGGLPRELNRLAGEIEREAWHVASRGRPAAARGRAADPRTAADLAGAPRRTHPTASALPAAVGLREWARSALPFLPHVGLGLGIPLALLALWLWLAPLFAAR
jgi:type II secretory pathway predicted ATPase ExeA